MNLEKGHWWQYLCTYFVWLYGESTW